MPDYTSVALMRATVPAIGSATSTTSADLHRFIITAEAIVNGKIAKAYTVPVVPAPPLLETLATDIALYRVLGLRFFTQGAKNRSEWVDRFKEAMSMLDDIAAGKIPLTTVSGTIIESDKGSAAMHSSTLGYNQTFTEDVEENSFVDSDKIQDIRADRS